MKKIISTAIASVLMVSAFAIGPTYDANTYEALPVEVNTNADEFGLSVYRNNSVVYFRTDSTAKEGSLQGVKIMKSNILPSGELSEPEECPELEAIGVCGSFAYDKQADKIYYSRYNKQKKVYQLYESLYADGAWSDPQMVFIKNITPTRMGMEVIENANWDYIDPGASIVQPALANKGNRLFFVSNLRKGHGKTDIWYIDREGEDWSEPINLGDSINTERSEAYPFIVGDSLMYYASKDSKDSKGSYDIYVARIKNVESGVTEYEPMGELLNSGSSDYNMILCANQVYLISNRGEQKEDIYHLAMLPQPEEILLAEVEPEVEPIAEVEPAFNFTFFLFDFDKSSMKVDSDPEVQALVAAIKQFPDRRFEVAGHTDNRGTDKYNDRLSLARANQVKNALVKNGIDEKQLVVKAYGKRNPKVQNAQTEEEHAQNRRVEVNFYNEQTND